MLLEYAAVFEKLQWLESRTKQTQGLPLPVQRGAHTGLKERLIRVGRQALEQRISGLCNGNNTAHPQINAIFEHAGLQIQLMEVLSLENEADKDRVRESYLDLCDVTSTKLSDAMELLVKSLRIED